MSYEPKKDLGMATKRHQADEIVTKLRQVDVLNAQGRSMAEAIRSIGVTEVKELAGELCSATISRISA